MPARDLSARALIEQLISFDTTSSLSNLELIAWVADYLDGHGIACSLTYDEGRRKANLFATIGPDDVGGVILSGHTDVVPVIGQPWSTDPFKTVEKDGKLYGRGTCDMKSFIALSLAMVPEFKARKLKTPIHFAFSFDEEVGCLGVSHLIRTLPEGARRPRLVIIGEPTSMKVVNAHKGCSVHACTVTGLEAHSSAPQRGVSSVLAANEIISLIARIADEHRQRARPESGFEPPYTTFNVGTITGGTAQNIIPRECRFTWEYRLLPGDDGPAIKRRVDDFIEADLLPRLRSQWDGASIKTEIVAEVPALVPQPHSPAEELARRLTGANTSTTISFATEGGHFQNADIPAIVCGPGSIDQAHQPDEFIALEQVEAGALFLRRLADWASA